MIKKLIVFAAIFLLCGGAVQAQSPLPVLETDLSFTDEATESATPSGIVERVVERKPDLTEPTGEVKNKLERVIEDNPLDELSWKNFLRHLIYEAVKQGVPVNTIVLILLFPMVVAMVAASRHLIGLRGLGILTPALLAVSFLATGISAGVVLFVIIIAVATLARMILKKIKVQYLPRMALMLWFVSSGVLLAFMGAAYIDYSGLITVGIFPILILMLLAETFIDFQVGRSTRDAVSLIASTFLLSFFVSFVIGMDTVQRSVLLYPEIIYFGVALFDLFMGKYVGLRLIEYISFRKLVVDKDNEE